MAITPDHAGFKEAQRRLRVHFGEDVVFYAPAVDSYPPGTAIDPQTASPYDPTIAPDSTVQAQVTVRCDVAFRSGAGADAEFDSAGITERTHVLLIADIDDRVALESAVSFGCRGERYAITSQKPDGIGGLQRWLVWGRR